jgi:hypothetical protein
VSNLPDRPAGQKLSKVPVPAPLRPRLRASRTLCIAKITNSGQSTAAEAYIIGAAQHRCMSLPEAAEQVCNAHRPSLKNQIHAITPLVRLAR